MLQARTARLISVLTFSSIRVRRGVLPTHALSVPKKDMSDGVTMQTYGTAYGWPQKRIDELMPWLWVPQQTP